MSRQETVKGTLIEVTFPNFTESDRDRFLYICGLIGFENIDSYYVDYPDEFINNNIFKFNGKDFIIKHK